MAENERPRLLYITVRNFDHGQKDGVVKKIYSHVDCFKKEGFETDLIYMMGEEKSAYILADGIAKKIGTYKRLSGIYGKKIIAHFLKNHLQKVKYDSAYIRFLNGRNDPWTIQILKVLKDNGVKIVFELPTYPYEGEKKGLMPMLDLCIDRIYRKQLKDYVGRIYCFAEETEIFGIKVLKGMNGVAVDNIKPVNPVRHDENEIHMIAVAMFQTYHGYQRIIQGVAEYRANGGTRKIVVHMVGDGYERKPLEDTVKSLGVEDSFIFYGRQAGDELDAIYNKADIALGPLAYFMIGMKISSNLKVREYMAKGLPFITGCTEDVFINNEQDFYYQSPNDATPIDVEAVIKWYDELISRAASREELISRIRKFAYDNVDMSITLKPVIDYIKDNEQ